MLAACGDRITLPRGNFTTFGIVTVIATSQEEAPRHPPFPGTGPTGRQDAGYGGFPVLSPPG